ncbi:formimidoylglutamate deiminase [Micromonospora sp. WMMD712]|uniref:formimidoylglutamate deiminase n=1 Tax=Micromonospora sp. WMMD712 TaxID=3016096 RepID=UPI00249A5E2B|nr:formimidoylglutamate deiminase [Micromonospora sp. WMMD712]WFE60331.1 formimidoylglutamate deiminase [Micromonospora sp. WMMD712]
MTATRWLAEHAWLPDRPEPTADVLIEADGGRITAIAPLSADGAPTAGVEVLADAVRLPGLTLPGLANAHSHAFHRALRGRTQGADGGQGGRGDFWSWRDRMYKVAARLDPDGYLALARAAYAEMALAGITCVGEFHYLHHGPDGTGYADPNAMGAALIEAAAQAGIRLTLLDTLYLTATVGGAPLAGPQRRFGDGDVDGWSDRHDRLTAAQRGRPHARIGAALHSVRAVPADQIAPFAARNAGVPLHVHLSEQPAENDACRAAYGCTPTRLLADRGALTPATTAVHATHLTSADVTLLGGARAGVCLCPTTERDLADGIGPARRLADAGVALSLGSDSHAVVDPFEEARAVELDERLRTRRRGHFAPAELLAAATAAGHAALGWADAGRLAVGARADLVTVRLDTARTAGVPPAGAFFAATAADVASVVVDGRQVVADGRHLTVDVPAELRAAIGAVTR